MVKIGHAVQDENGKSEGPIPGDQTGKEILVTNWYKRSGGWSYYLECNDDKMASKAASFMREIAENKAFGYSRITRWSGYKAIMENGGNIKGSKDSNFDCSSLAITCYILAGLDIPASGYTGSMLKIFTKTGKFKISQDSKYVDSPDYGKRGSLYLTPGKHVAMLLEDGPKAGDDPKPDPKNPRVEFLGNVYVRKGPGTEFKKVRIARKGEEDTLIEIAINSRQEEWYGIEDGYVSAFTGKKKKYTRLIGYEA